MRAFALVVLAAFAVRAEERPIGCCTFMKLAGLSRPSEVASAIQREIDAVSAAGGGRVVLPAGEWVSGTIWLRSGVELKLEKGCVLKASPDQSDYNAFDAYPQNFGIAREYWNAHHFIICHECRGIAITGPGEINGNGDAFYDEKPIRYESWMTPDATAWWNGIRWAKDKTALRPGQLVVFVESSDIRVENLTIRNSPCWTLFFHGCERVRVRDYTVRNGHDDGNSDGIDIDSSFDVAVENADIDTGDDAVAIRADGAKLKRPRACERIRLRNLKLGSQSSVFRLGVGKGEIRDIVVENVDCNRGGTAINLRTSYFGKDQVTDIGDVTFRNCRFRNCREALNVYLSGETLKYGIRNVRLENCDFGGAKDHVTVAPDCPFKEPGIVRDSKGDYPIACWTFMRQEEARPVEAVVKDWKDLGITHPMSPEFGAKSDKATMRRMLDLCEREGLHLIVHDMRVHLLSAIRNDILKDDAGYRRRVAEAAADWASHPAFAGFHLFDEPRQAQNAVTFKAAHVVRETVPGKMCFLNLLPWYDWIGKIVGATDHASYLDAMARGTGLGMMAYDLYDHMSEGSGETKGQSVYFENLRGWMEWTKREPGRSFWVTQLCESHASRVVHSQDDFRWQISTAAAMGAKGIIWYYPEQVRMSWNNRHLPINAFGERTENFNWMSWENRAFSRQFGSEFMRLTIEDAWLVNATGGGMGEFAGDRDIVSVETYGKKQPVLISFFRDADGVRYAAIVLLERRKTAHLTLGLADGVTAASRNWDGEYKPVAAQADPVLAQRHASPGLRMCGIDFAPGQLVLLKLTHRP